MRAIRCAVWNALALTLLTVPAFAAKHPATSTKHTPAPPPAHNFVRPDLTASVPAPLGAHGFRLSVTLIDAMSVVRKGDAVSFDVLTVSEIYGQYMGTVKQPPVGAIVYDIVRHQASCGWRTSRTLPVEAAPYEEGKPYRPVTYDAASLQDAFLETGSDALAVVDRACEGLPLNAAKGFASVSAAVAAWKGDFSPLPLPPPVMMMRRQIPADPWMDGAAPHRFTVVTSDGATGNMLLLDRGNVVRDGESVTAFSLALLGPQAQRAVFGGTDVAVLRKARYDCAARTMTVLAQASWDRYGWLVRQAQTPFAPRAAAQSDVVKADIDAACAMAASDGSQSFASVDAARDFQRDHWPVSPTGGWLACAWNRIPADRRQAYIAQWTPTFYDRIEAPAEDDVRAACAIPAPYVGSVVRKLWAYAKQRAALQRLADRHLDEATLLAAWNGAPWQDRLRAMWIEQGYSSEGAEWNEAFLYRLVTALQIKNGDSDGRAWLRAFISAQARIEGA